MTFHQKFNRYLLSFLLINLLIVINYLFFALINSKKTIINHCEHEITKVSNQTQKEARTLSKEIKNHLKAEIDNISMYYQNQYQKEIQTISHELQRQIDNLFKNIINEKDNQIQNIKEQIKNTFKQIIEFLNTKIDAFLTQQDKDKIMKLLEDKINNFGKIHFKDWFSGWFNHKEPKH